MSQYDINDPRNPNSPYNMENPRSPFYNPGETFKQKYLLDESSSGPASPDDCAASLGFLLAVGFIVGLGVLKLLIINAWGYWVNGIF